jgi:hypothetical protein
LRYYQKISNEMMSDPPTAPPTVVPIVYPTRESVYRTGIPYTMYIPVENSLEDPSFPPGLGRSESVPVFVGRMDVYTGVDVPFKRVTVMNAESWPSS